MINLFGKLFQAHARSEILGRIFALLNLKATSPEKGLDQQQIVLLTGRSVSTVSRVLDKMIKMKYCSYEEESGEEDRYVRRKYYPRRRYYIKASYREIAKATINQGIIDYKRMKEEIEKIKGKISDDEIDENSDLLTLLSRFTKEFDQLVRVFEKFIDLWPDAVKD